MLGLWGFLDGCIVWPSLLQEPMALADMRVVLGINLLLQCIYLPTGIIMATRAKPLVKGFIYQVPAPGMFALIGMCGVLTGRRRR